MVKAKAAPAKKTAVKKASVKTAPKKGVQSKAPPKKVAAPKKVVKAKPAPKKVAAKKPVATKAPPKKAAVVKKTPAKKLVAAKPAPKKVVAPKKAKAPKAPLGMPEQLRDAALKVLDERKASDIVTINMMGRSAMADYAIIASGGSARALGALSEYLREAFFKLGVRKVRIEGLPQGDWVLIDVGDVLIHLFRPEVRTFYQIEDIWSTTKKPKG